MFEGVYKRIANKIPGLELKLRQARMEESPAYYVKRTIFLSIFFSLGTCLFVFAFTKSLKTFLLFFIFFPLIYWYVMKYVDNRILKLKRGINQEIVFAGRFLIIELESGVPLYDVFKNLSNHYPKIGKYFREVVDKVDFGTSMEDALNEAIQLSPSPKLRKLFWQILNSLKTGSDVVESLDNVFDQIVREQQISVKEYGRKLNPLAMFYMMIAVIVPSLGTIMLIVLSSFLGFDVDLIVYLVIAGIVGFVQFMFLVVIKSSRPPVGM